MLACLFAAAHQTRLCCRSVDLPRSKQESTSDKTILLPAQMWRTVTTRSTIHYTERTESAGSWSAMNRLIQGSVLWEFDAFREDCQLSKYIKRWLCKRPGASCTSRLYCAEIFAALHHGQVFLFSEKWTSRASLCVSTLHIASSSPPLMSGELTQKWPKLKQDEWLYFFCLWRFLSFRNSRVWSFICRTCIAKLKPYSLDPRVPICSWIP